MILHAEHNPLLVWGCQTHVYSDLLARILDGVVQHIGDGCPQVLCIPPHASSASVHSGVFKAQRVRLQMVPRASQFHAIAHQLPEIDLLFFTSRFLVSGLARAKHLLDCAQQALGVVKHDPIELLTLRFRQFAAL